MNDVFTMPRCEVVLYLNDGLNLILDEFNIKNPHYLDKYKKSKDILPVNLNECSELIDPVPVILFQKVF